MSPVDSTSKMSRPENYLQNEHAEEDPRPATPPPTPPAPPSSVRRAVADLHRHLDACRHLLIADELTRLRQSRAGRGNWVWLWNWLYEEDYVDALVILVDRAIWFINRLFFLVLRKLCALTREIDRRADAATSLEEIDGLMDEMSGAGLTYCEMRRVYALHTLMCTKWDVLLVPIMMTNSTFDAMIHDIFGLDNDGHYFPEDKITQKQNKPIFVFDFGNIGLQPGHLTPQGFTVEAECYFVNRLRYPHQFGVQYVDDENELTQLTELTETMRLA